MNLDDQNFLSFLSDKYPYLYDIEMGVRKIQTSTGFGEVSFNIRVASGKVDKGSTVTVEDKLYRQRVDNML